VQSFVQTNNPIADFPHCNSATSVNDNNTDAEGGIVFMPFHQQYNVQTHNQHAPLPNPFPEDPFSTSNKSSSNGTLYMTAWQSPFPQQTAVDDPFGDSFTTIPNIQMKQTLSQHMNGQNGLFPPPIMANDRMTTERTNGDKFVLFPSFL
jgi:hypothetical protein